MNLEELALIERTQAFVDTHVAPGATDRARAGHGSRPLLGHAAQAGLLGLQVPIAMGGLGLGFSCKVRAIERIAAADFGVALAVVNTHNAAEHIARMARDEVARRWVRPLIAGEVVGCTALTEPSAGSDVAAIRTRAERLGSGWRLDGEKCWIINARLADVVIVYAQTRPGAGVNGIAAFVIDAQQPGFQRAPGWSVGPVATMDTGGFGLHDYRCDEAQLLAPPGAAFTDIIRSINGARIYVGAACCGMVDTALKLAAGYGLRRHAFGKNLHGHQGWRWRLADAAIDLDAARLLVERAAATVDAGQDAQTDAAKAKVFATRMAQRHLSELLHAMGAAGLDDRHPLLRHLAAAQVAALVDGSTEMLLERIARDVRGTQPAPLV